MSDTASSATNDVLRLLDARCSTRAYDPTPLTDAEKQAILHAATRAPTAGNLLLYSILEIEDQALKDRLAVTCDDQPFIARAPWLLLFVADYQKWMDLFDACGCDDLPGVPAGRTPGPGDLLLAVDDALIAAQNAVIAAESLGIGSCYIGDVMELGEKHAELLHLPRWTFPAALLCFGRPKVRPHRTGRYERHVVHKDVYRRLTPGELAEVSAELDALHGVRESREGVRGCVQDVYARKFTADFSVEMDRSVAWWLERWTDGEKKDGGAGGAPTD